MAADITKDSYPRFDVTFGEVGGPRNGGGNTVDEVGKGCKEGREKDEECFFKIHDDLVESIFDEYEACELIFPIGLGMSLVIYGAGY